jgi:hypothetical protein
MASKPRRPDSGKHRPETSKPLKSSDSPKWIEVPVSVVLLVPVPNSLPGDQDNMKEDAVELVRQGRLSLDGVWINHRLAK